MEQKPWVRSCQPYLWLVMWHVLNKRLVWKLLRTIGNVLCGVSWRGSHDRGACCRGGVHHGALMMLVLPLLGHIWYCRKGNSVKNQHLHGTKYTDTSTRLCRTWPSCLPLWCQAITAPTTTTSVTLGHFPTTHAVPQPQTLIPQLPALAIQLESNFLRESLYDEPPNTTTLWDISFILLLRESLFYNTTR